MVKQDLQLVADDPWLQPYKDKLLSRQKNAGQLQQKVAGSAPLKDVSYQYEFLGMHKNSDGSWVFCEWAPNATEIYILCDKNGWHDDPGYSLNKLENGVWEIHLSADKIKHQDTYKLHIYWAGGDG